MTISVTTIIISSLMGILIAIVTFYYTLKLMKARSSYSDENKAILEGMRDSIEKQMYALNDRLVLTEERWLDVNHLLYSNQLKVQDPVKYNQRQTYYSEFLRANGVFENNLQIDDKFVFILTPFNDSYHEEYLAIKEACRSVGFKAERGDEKQFALGDIFSEMLRNIVKARLIIANINGRNPNVMYELGIAHALDKPVLLVSKDPGTLPFDIKSKRFIFYNNYNHLQDLIRRELLANIGTRPIIE